MAKTLGILGGLGPRASVYFYYLLTEHTAAACDADHMNIILMSAADIPDRSEYILGKSDRSPLPEMKKNVERLIAAGADLIAIPCNTAHYFFDALQKTTPVPVLNIVQETVSLAAANGAKRLGILATTGTVRAGAYQHAASNLGLTAILPEEEEQEALMRLIYNDIKTAAEPNYDCFYEIADHLLSRGCDALILGCTELSLIPKDARYDRYPMIDSLLVLTAKCISACGKTPRALAEIYTYNRNH